MIHLYAPPASSYSRRVTVVMAEKGIAHESVALDMRAGDHKSARYLALNPYGRVPTLVDDDFVLYESTAIINYLEATHPHPPLLPTGARERALVEMHSRLCDLEFSKSVSAVAFPKRFLPKERWPLEAMDKARLDVERHLTSLDAHLAQKTYLVAEQFTLADVCYLPFLEFLGLVEVAVPPKVAAWAERLLSRPSAQLTRPPF